MKTAPKYEIGDLVKVKDLERLKADLGDPIRAQCGWMRGMDRYAGGVYEVREIMKSTNGGFHHSYRFIGTSSWWFSDDTLEDAEDYVAEETTSQSIHMSYAEIMNML